MTSWTPFQDTKYQTASLTSGPPTPALTSIHESTVLLLQAFHALQYLSFPIRVELNEYTNPLHKWRHMTFYYVVLVVFGLLAFNWASLLQAPKPWPQFAFAIVIAVNLHHYFTDAVIWKIRNPAVRQSLFGHLEASTH